METERGRLRPWALTRRLLALVPGARPLLLRIVLLSATAAAAMIVQAYLLADVLTKIFLDRQPPRALLPLLLATLAALVVRTAADGWARLGAADLGYAVRRTLRHGVVERLFALGPLFQDRPETGSLVPTLLESVDALAVFAGQYLPRLWLAFLIPALVWVGVAHASWPAALVLLLTGPLVPFFMILIGQAAERRATEQWTALYRLNAHFLDLVEGLATLILFGQVRRQPAAVAQVSHAYRRGVLRNLRLALTSALVLEGFAALATALVAVFVGLELVAGRIAYPPALTVLLLVPEFYVPQRELGGAFHKALSAVAASEAVFRTLEWPLPAVDGGLEPPQGAVHLRFEGVSFRYPDRAEPLFAGLHLHVAAGESLAVEGESGSGKSTLCRLVLGYLRPSDGRILVDALPLEALHPVRWRAQVTYVPQSPYFLSGSLRENLLVAKPEADDDALWWALERALLADFVRRLPQGLDTPVGHHALRLSGGQAQRLALARAFLRATPVVVLDEPTAHLDRETAKRLWRPLGEFLAGRTVLLVTHRPGEAAALADRRIVLRAGQGLEEALP